MILTKDQAKAIYTAMCGMNNVSGRILCNIATSIRVQETVSGTVFVQDISREEAEGYNNQNAFASAYGLSD